MTPSLRPFRLRPGTIGTGALVLVTLLAAPSARAQWSSDAAANLTVAARPAGQAQPKMAPTADGGFYVSWFGGGGDGYDVYLQRLDARGVAQWTPGGVRVADRNLSSTQDYGLSVDAAGNALVVFRYPDAGGVLQAVASRVSPAGVLLWGQPGVFVSADASEAASPRVAGTADGGAVVAWTSFASGDIVLQKVDAAGVRQWAPSGVALATPTGTFYIADLHAASDGGVIVSGSAQLSFSSRRLWAQKLALTDGAPLWGAAPVEVFDGTGGALQLGYFPEFVPDEAGGAVFAWYQVSGAASATVRVQHVRGDGAVAFAQNGIDAGVPGARQRYAPSAAYDAATGDIYVVWPEEEQAGTVRTFGVAAQRVSSAGVRQWGDGGRTLVPMGGEQASQVRALPAPGGAVFAYVLGSAPSPMPVSAVRLDAAGAPLWPGGTVALKTGATQTTRMQGARSSAGFWAYAWADGPDGVALKAQNVRPVGDLGNPIVAGEGAALPPSLSLRSASSNPFSGRATLVYTLPGAVHARLEVFDGTGRRVAVLADGARGDGRHEAVWDAAGLPGGVYVVRLRAGERTATMAIVVAR